MKKIYWLLLIIFGIISSLMAYFSWPLISYRLWPQEQGIQFRVPETILKTGGYPHTAKGVLEEYLRLDAKGGYFSDEGLRYLGMLSPKNLGMRDKMLFVWIIKDYHIRYLETTPDKVIAEVEYRLLGYLEQSSWFEPVFFKVNKKKEMYTVEIVHHDGKWLIDTGLYSYITAHTSIEYIKQAASISSPNSYIANNANKLISEIENAE